MTFLLPEIGTSGSLDGPQTLVVKGRFAPKNFEGIMCCYISKLYSLSAGDLVYFLVSALFYIFVELIFQNLRIVAASAVLLCSYFSPTILHFSPGTNGL